MRRLRIAVFAAALVSASSLGSGTPSPRTDRYQIRQFRSQGTARSRVAHLTAFFGRDARAAALTTY